MPLAVIATLAGATTLVAWGLARVAEDERRWARWVGRAALLAGGAGFVAAIIMVLR